MTKPAMSIGELAAQTEVKVPTIRFYEQIGLLPAPDRTASARRVYGEGRRAAALADPRVRQLGFSTDAIRTLLHLSDNPDTDCGRANALAAEQLTAVEAKIGQLQRLRAELQRLAGAGCGGGRASDCQVIEALAEGVG